MDNIEKELELRKRILEELEHKREVAMKSGATDNEIGKIVKSIEQVKNGDLTSSSIVKALVKSAEQMARIQMKKRTQSQSNQELERIIDTYNFYQSSTGNSIWFYQTLTPDEYGNRAWVSIKKDALLSNFRALDVYIRLGEGQEDYSSFKEFNSMLVEKGRTFTKIVQSYRDHPGCLNIINRNFCPPAEDGRQDYHWIFDAIIESISGGQVGDPESFGPFQQTIWCKYLHPDNPFLPNLFIRDLDGRAGKGLISNTFLKTLFQGNVADNCNTDHVTGKFNSVVAGKAIVVVNETKRDKVDVERMKAFLGSPKIMVEAKYQTPYEADNTSLVMSYSNEASGGITLSGTSSDNRYSIFTTTKNIYQTCQRYFLEQEGAARTLDEVKQWLEGDGADSGQNLLRSSEQVGRWINAMAQQLGDVESVRPVHGVQYRKMLERQRGAWLETVEQVFTDPNFNYIRDDLLQRLVRYCNPSEIIPGKKTMREKIQRLSEDLGLEVILQERAKIWTNRPMKQSMQRTVWRLNKGTDRQSNLDDNDEYYGTEEYGKWTWKWK